MNLLHIHIRDDGFTIQFHRPFHTGRGRSGRREQHFDKPARVFRIEPNNFMAGHKAPRRFPRVCDDKRRHRASFQRGGLVKNPLVRRGYPGDEALAFRFFQCRRHAPNVCLYGTQIKNQF